MRAAGEGREIQKAEVDGLLELVGEVAGKQDDGDVRFEAFRRLACGLELTGQRVDQFAERAGVMLS
jgi:hypothetical protein